MNRLLGRAKSKAEMAEMKQLSILPIRTPIFYPGHSLSDHIINSCESRKIPEGSILAITSKIVSLEENRLVSKASITKSELIDREAEYNLGPIGYGSILTIKEGLLIASAGIDESNSESGHYILYPENPFQSAKRLWSALKTQWDLNDFGVLLTDSRTGPLRLGVTGVSLAYWGFSGLENKVGSRDLFDRELQMTKINIADGLASAASLVMGEGNESTPLALINGAQVRFETETDPSELRIPVEDDLYYPLFKPLIR